MQPVDKEVAMSKIAVFLANGFEEIEALTVVDICRRAGITVDMVSIQEDAEATGSHGICVKADMVFADAAFEEYDMLVLPGGLKGMQNLEACEVLMEQIDAFYKSEKYIAAICASPSIFGRRGILEGREATVYPGFEEELKGAIVVDEQAVDSEHVITGRSMGGAIDFALLLVEKLLGEDKAEEIVEQIVY